MLRLLLGEQVWAAERQRAAAVCSKWVLLYMCRRALL